MSHLSQLQEQLYLNTILKKLQQKLEEVSTDILKQDQSYRELQHYIVDQKAQLDKFEMLQQQQELSMIDKRGYSQTLHKDQLLKLIDSPYFGKFNFVYEGEDIEDAEQFYIGRFGFSDEDGRILINDWRAPVCHMYYEFELGSAYYEALGRRFDGKLISKQQFKIEQSKLIYTLDSSLAIQDQVLQDTLNKHTEHKMKTIVATIQREQNRIVRHDSANTMVIQGVAGSGKTAVALHRIAYLLYKFRDTLDAQHIFILSPNKVFADYIATVLPELGEEPIRSFTLDELTAIVLDNAYTFNSFEQEVKSIINQPQGELAQRTKYKANYHFVEKLNSYLEQLDYTILHAKPLHFVGYDFDEGYIASRFLAYKKAPVLKRLVMVADDIVDVLQSKRNGELELPRKKVIVQALQELLKFQNPMDIYKSFILEQDSSLFHFDGKTLEFNDVYPYLYCQIYFKGITTFEGIQYFVLDEMQDYTPIQYAVLAKIFECKKTIIGDFGQALLPFEAITKTAFEQLFVNIDYTELTTSYRSSYEIATFANRFATATRIDPIERHGEEPKLLYYSNEAEMLHSLDVYSQNSYKTTAIICKTEEDLKQLQAHFKDRPYLLLNGETKTFATGLILTTIQYAKGLEFDAVIIPYVNRTNYSNDFDRGLLYIASTRAMHQLILLNDANESSPLI